MCDPLSLIMGIGSIFGAVSNKPPPPPLPPKPVIPTPTASGRQQTTKTGKVNVALGGTRTQDKARKTASSTAASKTSGSTLRTSNASGINII